MSADSMTALVVTVGSRGCAIPLQHVRETLRPLAVERVAGVPAYVRGISVIRGQPVPVVDLALLVGEGEVQVDTTADGERQRDGAARLVLLQLGERQVAVAVQAVVGVRRLGNAQFGALPPLLEGAAERAVESAGVRDAQLMLVLRASRLIPDQVWPALDSWSA